MDPKQLAKGMIALTVEAERKEILAALDGKEKKMKNVKLQYLKGSAKMGLRLWNLLAPQLPEYKTYGGNNGYPTFSLQTLKNKGLI